MLEKLFMFQTVFLPHDTKGRSLERKHRETRNLLSKYSKQFRLLHCILLDFLIYIYMQMYSVKQKKEGVKSLSIIDLRSFLNVQNHNVKVKLKISSFPVQSKFKSFYWFCILHHRSSQGAKDSIFPKEYFKFRFRL